MRKPYESPEYAAAKAGVLALTTSLGGAMGERPDLGHGHLPGLGADRGGRAGGGWDVRDERAELPGLVPVEEIAGLIVRLATDESLAGRVIGALGGRGR